MARIDVDHDAPSHDDEIDDLVARLLHARPDLATASDSDALLFLVVSGGVDRRTIERTGRRLTDVVSRWRRHVELIEAMVPDDVPGRASVLQARRNAEARTELLNEFGALTSAEVADVAQSRATNRAALANRWKNERRIFAIRSRGQDLFPGFQFDESGQPRSVIAAVIDQLGDVMGDWELALWFTTASGALGGRRPVDCLDDTDAVVGATVAEVRDVDA